MKISLLNNKGFQWFNKTNIYCKGYFFDSKNNFYNDLKTINFLSKISNKSDFINTVKQLNGNFTIIIQINNQCYIASDTTRIFPVFYTYQNNELHISDDICFLKETYNINTFDELAELELKSSLHTYGTKTLLKNVLQIQSDEYLIIENNQIKERGFLFSYAVDKFNSSTYESLKKQAITAFENSFERLIISLENKPVVIPLSGGFDSRLIAVMLKKHNYKNVTCFTYGRANSFEIKNSKKTAKALGFDWCFVEYNETIYKKFNNSELFKDYTHYAGKYSSMPYLQEYFAVKHLKEHKKITNDAVFISGFAGDLLGGSQFIKVIPKNLKLNEITNLILNNKFNLYKLKGNEKKKIKNALNKTIENTYKKQIPSSVFEDIDVKEKITKFIFNSASYYTFFGYQHRFPFWDKELLSFFKDVPETFKYGKTFFDEILTENYFKPFNVNFKKEIQPSKHIVKLQKVKNKLRPYLPSSYKRRLLSKNDWSNYEAFTKLLLIDISNKNLHIKRTYKQYNEILAQWYIFFCKNKM